MNTQFALPSVPQRSGRLAVFACAALAFTAPRTGHAQTGSRFGDGKSAEDTVTSVAAVFRRAHDTSPSARVSLASARIAVQSASLAAAPLLPFISLEATALRQTLNIATFGFPGPSAASDPFNVYTGGVRAQQTLIDPAAWRRVGAQRDSARAAIGDDAAFRDVLGTGAAARYYQLLAAEASLTGRQADSLLASAVLNDATDRRRVGDVTDIDVTRARLGVSAAAFGLTRSRAALSQARLDLALALGLPLARLPVVRDSLRGPAPLDTATMTKLAGSGLDATLTRRGDVLASRFRARAASGLSSARRLELLPRVTAFGEFAATGVATARLPAVYRTGVQVSMPLVDGFSRFRRAGIDAEQERIAAAVAEETALRAAREVIGASVELERAVSGLSVTEAQLELALEELAQARARVRAGVGSTLETTQGIAAVAAARDQVIAGRLDYHLARVEWHRATATLDALR